MKICISILLICTVGFRPIVPIIEYCVDYKYISTVLCINKDKPKLKCNGTCHLMKQIAKTTEEGAPSKSEKPSLLKSLSDYIPKENYISFAQESVSQFFQSRYSNLYQYIGIVRLLKPPKK